MILYLQSRHRHRCATCMYEQCLSCSLCPNRIAIIGCDPLALIVEPLRVRNVMHCFFRHCSFFLYAQKYQSQWIVNSHHPDRLTLMTISRPVVVFQSAAFRYGGPCLQGFTTCSNFRFILYFSLVKWLGVMNLTKSDIKFHDTSSISTSTTGTNTSYQQQHQHQNAWTQVRHASMFVSIWHSLLRHLE